MSFKTSNEEFYKIFGNPDNVVPKTNANNTDRTEYIKRLRKELKNYLKDKKYPSARAFYAWLDKGGSFTHMSCRADMVNDLSNEFLRVGVAYILVEGAKGRYGFLARSCDVEKQNIAIKNVLEAQSKYCSITNGENAVEFYNKKSELKDKDMVAIGGLNEEEIYILKDACNKVLPEQTIGIDEMEDGTYLLTFHGKSSLDFTSDSNMATALIESLITLNGNSANITRNKTKADIAYSKEYAKGFPDKNGTLKNSVWIVGNERKFVERSLHGFRVGYPREEEDEIFLEEEFFVNKDDPEYKNRLNSALFQISNRKCLYTEPDVKMYFKIRKPYIESLKVAGEKQLVTVISRIVSENLNRSHISGMSKNWDVKLDLYKKEISKVIEAAKNAQVPKGYDKKDIIAIMAIAKNYGLKLDALTPALQRMSMVKVYDRNLQQQLIKDLDKELDRAKTIARGRVEPEREEIKRDEYER